MADPARSWLASQDCLVKSEYATPWGICDLVGVVFREEQVAQRLKLGQRKAIGPPQRIELLGRIPEASSGTSIRVDTLRREYADLFSENELSVEIDTLLSSRFVTMPRRGCLQRINGWEPLHKTIVALELKLRRVEEALAQASAHLAFADESYVGLPRDRAERLSKSPRAEDFRECGVGIVAIDEESGETVLRPGRRLFGIDPVLQKHCVERFWRTLP